MEQKVASSKKPANTKKTKAFANKRTMNFARHESTLNLKKVAIVMLVIVVLGGVFAKFAVLDQLAKKTAAYADLSAAQDRLAAINIRMTKYNEVKAEYDRYGTGRMDEEEVSTVERTAMLNIIESVIMPNAVIGQIQASGNVAEVVLHGIDPAAASELVAALEKDELVADVLVNHAESNAIDPDQIIMTIYMRKVVE